jgi:class 3 adenylate cyclase
MTNMPGVAYDLAREVIFLVDLANASLQITSDFRAVKAAYVECSDVAGVPDRVFALPLKKEKDGDRAFACGSLSDDDIGASGIEIVRLACDLFCGGETGADTPAVVHAASLDVQRGHLLHVLLFARCVSGSEGLSPCMRIVRAVCIWETANGSTYGAKTKGMGQDGAFPRFIRAEGLSSRDHISGFLLFNSIFERKIGSLAFVNSEFVERAWNKMLWDGSVHSHLPWERRRLHGGSGPGSDVGTVTLSLDLRKSTYMMRQAQDRTHYAYWLETLAEIARDFTLRHGGIYDKFTGDGAISHFVYDTEDAGHLGRDRAICAAFNCAQDLIVASGVHLHNIEPELDFLSGKSGSAVGLAHGPAAWSLDRDGRPVVVGTGVVSACRLCGGPSGSIRATISVKSVLERYFQGLRFDPHHLESDHKDLAIADDPICGQFFLNDTPISSSSNEIRARAAAIWNEVKARHS